MCFLLPTIVVTVTQTVWYSLSGKTDVVDWIDSLDSVSPADLEEQMNSLGAVRCKFPGLCALNFQWLLDLVLDKLVGNNPSRTGIFGLMEAFGAGIEEQGRKTLHGHILVYIKHWNDLLRKLHSALERVRSEAEAEIRKIVDSVVSTELQPTYMNNGFPNRHVDQQVSCPSCDYDVLQYPTLNSSEFYDTRWVHNSWDLPLLHALIARNISVAMNLL